MATAVSTRRLLVELDYTTVTTSGSTSFAGGDRTKAAMVFERVV